MPRVVRDSRTVISTANARLEEIADRVTVDYTKRQNVVSEHRTDALKDYCKGVEKLTGNLRKKHREVQARVDALTQEYRARLGSAAEPMVRASVTACQKLLCAETPPVKDRKSFRKWMLKNHPDKLDNPTAADVAKFSAVYECVNEKKQLCAQ